MRAERGKKAFFCGAAREGTDGGREKAGDTGGRGGTCVVSSSGKRVLREGMAEGALSGKMTGTGSRTAQGRRRERPGVRRRRSRAGFVRCTRGIAHGPEEGRDRRKTEKFAVAEERLSAARVPQRRDRRKAQSSFDSAAVPESFSFIHSGTATGRPSRLTTACRVMPSHRSFVRSSFQIS